MLLKKPWVLVIGTVFAFLIHLVWLEDRKIDRKLDWEYSMRRRLEASSRATVESHGPLSS